MTRDTWAGLYRKLTVAFNKPISAEHAGVLFDGLEDLADERMTEAVTRIIRVEKHFPAVATIREMSVQIGAETKRATPVVTYTQMTDEQRDGLLAAVRAAKEKVFGRMS